MGTVNPSGKDRIDEMRRRAQGRRAVAMLESIKRRGEAVRNLFAHGTCDICGAPVVRYEGDRGFVCAAGHRASLNATSRRLEGVRAEQSRAVTREHELLEARGLQSKRRRGTK